MPGTQPGAIARYNTNGSLDKSFGISGQAACVAAAAAIGIQSNGKIVVAGTIPSALLTLTSGGITVADNQSGFGVVRYNATGGIDTTFNSGAASPVAAASSLDLEMPSPRVGPSRWLFNPMARLWSPDWQAWALTGDNTSLRRHYVLARYTAAGLLDTTFGPNGTVITILSPGPPPS